jgi:hypothetical protein
MKKLLVVSILIVATSSALLASHLAGAHSQRTLTIKVTSATLISRLHLMLPIFPNPATVNFNTSNRSRRLKSAEILNL